MAASPKLACSSSGCRLLRARIQRRAGAPFTVPMNAVAYCSGHGIYALSRTPHMTNSAKELCHVANDLRLRAFHAGTNSIAIDEEIRELTADLLPCARARLRMLTPSRDKIGWRGDTARRQCANR